MPMARSWMTSTLSAISAVCTFAMRLRLQPRLHWKSVSTLPECWCPVCRPSCAHEPSRAPEIPIYSETRKSAMNSAVLLDRIAHHDMIHLRNEPHYKVGVHPLHARIYHITPAREALEVFFAKVAHIDVQNLQYVPFARFLLAQTFCELMGRHLRSTLRSILTDRNSGGFTIGVQDATMDPHNYIKFATAIAYMMGPANFD